MPSILPWESPSLILSPSPSDSIIPGSPPSATPTQPKPKLEITMPATMTLGNFHPPLSSSSEFKSFVTTLEDTIGDFVQRSLKRGQRLLGVKVRKVGDSLLARKLRILQNISLTKIEYDVLLEQLCDTNSCDNIE